MTNKQKWQIPSLEILDISMTEKENPEGCKNDVPSEKNPNCNVTGTS